MARDRELDEVDQRIDEAKSAAAEEERSSPAPEGGDQPVPTSDPVFEQNEDGFAPA